MSSDIQDLNLFLNEHRNPHKDYYNDCVSYRKDFLSASYYSEPIVSELCD